MIIGTLFYTSVFHERSKRFTRRHLAELFIPRKSRHSMESFSIAVIAARIQFNNMIPILSVARKTDITSIFLILTDTVDGVHERTLRPLPMVME